MFLLGSNGQWGKWWLRVSFLVWKSDGRSLLGLVCSSVMSRRVSLWFFCPFPRCLKMTVTASGVKSGLDIERSRERWVQWCESLANLPMSCGHLQLWNLGRGWECTQLFSSLVRGKGPQRTACGSLAPYRVCPVSFTRKLYHFQLKWFWKLSLKLLCDEQNIKMGLQCKFWPAH